MATRSNNLVQQFHLAVLRDVDALTDGELLARFREHRDGDAFAAIVRRHGPMVWGVCRRALGDRQDLEDAFQAAFLVLVRRAKSLREPDALGSWLHGVARRTAAKARSRRAKRLRRERPAGEAAEPASPGDPAAGDRRIDLDAALSQLPDRYRTAVVLCDLEERTRGEVSRQFGVPEGTVAGWLTRGREMLARRLSSHGPPVAGAAVAALLAQTSAAAVPPVTVLEGAMGLGGAEASPSVSHEVSSLAREVANAMIVSKLKFVSTAALILAVTGGSLGALLKDAPPAAPPMAKQSPAAIPAKPPAKMDAFGDPLPAGAALRLGTTRYRIPDLAAVGFRPGGELVAFGADLSLHVFPADGSPTPKIVLLTGKKQPAWYRAMSANAKYAAGWHEGKLVVWDVSGETPVEHTSLVGKTGSRKTFSPDGEWLAMQGETLRLPQGERAVIHLCHLPTKAWRQLEQPWRYLETMAFSGDGRSLAAAGESDVYVIESKTAEVRSKVRLPRERPGHVALSPDGTILAVSCMTTIHSLPRPIGLFSTKDGKELPDWKGPSESAYWVRFTLDGKRLLIGSREGVLEWDPATGTRVRDIPCPTNHSQPAAVSADGKTMAFPSEDAVMLWDVAAAKPIHGELIEAGHTGKIRRITISPDGRMIATATHREIRLWSADDGRAAGRFACGDFSGRMAFLPDSGSFIAIDKDYVTPVLWDAKTGKAIRRFPYPAEHAKRETSKNPRVSTDGKTLTTDADAISSDGQGYRMSWDVTTGKLLDRVEHGESSGRDEERAIGGLAVSPDGNWQITYGTVKNISTKEGFKVIPSQESLMMPAAFSNDSRLVFASRADEQARKDERGSLVLFDLQAKKQVAELNTGLVLRLCVSPDARYVAVMGRAELVLWDITAKGAVRRFKTEHGPALRRDAIAFTPDGRRLITAADDGTAVVWELAAKGNTDKPLLPKELDAAWLALAGNDAVRAYVAKWELVDHPDQAMALLRDRLKPVQPIEATVVFDLMKRFDAKDFRDREAASAAIRGLGEAAVPHLKQALKGNLSAEQKQRAEALLGQAASGEVLRGLHGVAMLEVLATEECRRTLENLAKGLPESKVTQEADRVLQRMKGRK